MVSKVAIVIAAIAGLAWAIRSKQLQSLIITLLMCLGILLLFMKGGTVQHIGFITYIVACFGAIVYAFLQKDIDLLQRAVILAIAFPVFLLWLLLINHWPGTKWVKTFMFIPVLAFLLSFSLKNKFKSEYAFLVILCVDAILISLRFWFSSSL